MHPTKLLLPDKVEKCQKINTSEDKKKNHVIFSSLTIKLEKKNEYFVFS